MCASIPEPDGESETRKGSAMPEQLTELAGSAIQGPYALWVDAYITQGSGSLAREQFKF